MRVFLDTNVLLDWITQRGNLEATKVVMEQIEKGQIEGFLSFGSLYTISYVIDKALKKDGIHKTSRLEKVRNILLALLANMNVAVTGYVEAFKGTKNLMLDDIEDSFQYQAAFSSYCDFLLTQNIQDFKNCDQNMFKVLTPEQYVNLYC